MRALTIVAVVLAFAAALAAGRALGQTSRADFAALDRNGDGRVSKVEALADREIHKRFAEFDADKDGRLSEQEYVLAVEDIQQRVLRDAAISARVRAALQAERALHPQSIAVDTYEGRVQLKGLVKAPELVSRAGRVSASVEGVRAVDNNILVVR